MVAMFTLSLAQVGCGVVHANVGHKLLIRYPLRVFSSDQ
jgi:hypothetical protein